MSRRIARPYAAALFQVVQREGSEALRVAGEQLAAAAAIISSDQAFLRVFEVPSVPPATKRALVTEVAAGIGARPEVVRLLTLMTEHLRLRMLFEVVDLFRQAVDRRDGVVRGRIVVPAELPRVQVEALARALQARVGGRVELEAVVDPDLLAGFIVRVGSQVFDGSVRSQLARFAAQTTL